MCRIKKSKYLMQFLLFLGALIVFSGRADAQSLNCIEPLVFGQIINCPGTGTVTVEPDGSSSDGGCIVVGGAPQSRARCVITQGFPFRPIQVSVDSASTTISSGGNNMTVDDFNIITNTGGTTFTQTVGTPFLDVPIGATLNVGAGQASGTYSGTMGVTAILQ